MPVTALLSILHRAAGVLLTLSIPGLLYIFDLSLRNEQAFNFISNLLNGVMAKTVLILFLWLLCHHFLAGLRFLLIDMDIWVKRAPARFSAWFVHIAALVITLLIGGWMI